MSTHHKELFYVNCYNLVDFEMSNSFYKSIISDIDNLEIFKYEYESSIY